MIGMRCAVVFILGIFTASQSVAGVSLDQVLQDALNEVDKLKSFVKSTSSRIESDVAGAIKGAYAGFDNEADKLLQNAGPGATQVGACVDGLKATVDADADALSKEAVQCVTAEADAALDDVEAVVASVQSAERDIAAARASLKACDEIAEAVKKAECVLKETASVAAEEVSLARKVSGAVGDAVKLYNTFQSSVSSCESSQLKKAQQDAASLTAKLTSCK